MADSGSRRSLRNRGARVWAALIKTYEDFDRHDYLTYAAALAFYSLLSLFPLLIFLASLLAVLPIPHLFDQSLAIMARIVPSDAMHVVRGVLQDALLTNRGIISFGFLATVVSASGGFNSLITALNVAYEVPESRPYWRKQVVAVCLTLLVGLMVAIVLVMMALGPRFGIWLSAKFNLSWLFADAWPHIRWIVIVVCTILSVEILYFFGPSVRQRFKDQIPGAVVAVLSWIGASWVLGWYLTSVVDYKKMFGTLGAVVGLMLWFYITALALIAGAEINAEFLQTRRSNLPSELERTPGSKFNYTRRRSA
jgi:membrane protein